MNGKLGCPRGQVSQSNGEGVDPVKDVGLQLHSAVSKT